MTDQYLMEKDGGKMNVTPDKLDEYLAEGWIVLKTPQENKQPPVVEQEVPEEPEMAEEPEEPEEAVSAETDEKTKRAARAGSASRKPKSKG